MERIVYVTGNYGKYISVKEHFQKENIDIDFFECDLEELDVNDIEQISKAKAFESYKILNKPCFAADSGFYIDNYPGNPGYPGAFVKRSGISKNIEQLLETMKDVEDRSCKFLDCLTFYDGKEFYTFWGESKGRLANTIRGTKSERAKSNLWYVFIPQNSNKTLSEMNDLEFAHRNDGNTSATNYFIEWYKNNYINKSRNLVYK